MAKAEELRLHDGYIGFLTEGDPIVREQLERAGLTLQMEFDDNGRLNGFNLVPTPQPEEELF